MEYPYLVCYACKTPFLVGDDISALAGSEEGRVILVHKECNGAQ